VSHISLQATLLAEQFTQHIRKIKQIKPRCSQPKNNLYPKLPLNELTRIVLRHQVSQSNFNYIPCMQIKCVIITSKYFTFISHLKFIFSTSQTNSGTCA
jgi:hypothetical protein